MSKPNSLICDKCSIINNTLRCMLCKHKTEEWQKKNLGSRPIVMLSDSNLYKTKAENMGE